MMNRTRVVAAVVASISLVGGVTAVPVGTVFRYQGQLKQGGLPVNDTCDFFFQINGAGMNPVNVSPTGVVVANGLFAVDLDFGAAPFTTNEDRFLTIAVSCPSGSPSTPLAGSQRLRATPFSLATRGINVSSAGYVGVGLGTTIPSHPLHVFQSGGGNSPDTVRIDTDVPGIFGGLRSIVINEGEIDSDGLFIGSTIPLSLNFNSSGNVLLADGGGNVGINVSGSLPVAKLHVIDTNPATRDVQPAGGGVVVIGDVSGANLAFDDNEIMARNNGATSTLFLNNNGGTVRVPVLQITGADVAEKFPVSETMEPGMVVAIDPVNPGKLRVARGAYNRRVAGVVSGANGLSLGAVLGNLPESENAPPIALCGRVYVRADTTNGPIQPGDLLTTSNMPGRAMKVTDYSKARGATIGKAMTSLSKGKGLVLVLIQPQ